MATTNLYLIPWKLMLVYLNMPPLWRSLSICVYFIMCSILTISKKHVRLKNLQKPFFAKYWFTIINISLKWFVAIMLQKWNFHLMVVYSSDGIVRTALLNTLQHKLYFMLLEKQFIHETDILYHSIFRILKRRYRHVSLMCQNNDRKKKNIGKTLQKMATVLFGECLLNKEFLFEGCRLIFIPLVTALHTFLNSCSGLYL